MSCCGQNRQAWREWNQAKVQAPAPAPPVLQNPVTVHHLGNASLVIKGAVSGHTYLFAGNNAGLSVDERDVPELLATRQFSLES